jgi:hypothetical protein
MTLSLWLQEEILRYAQNDTPGNNDFVLLVARAVLLIDEEKSSLYFATGGKWS